MERDKIIIRLYEILNKENEGERVICRSEDSDFDEGFETGCNIERRYYESGIKQLLKEIKKVMN